MLLGGGIGGSTGALFPFVRERALLNLGCLLV